MAELLKNHFAHTYGHRRVRRLYRRRSQVCKSSVAFKNLRRNIHKILHPRRVQVVHVDGTPVDEKIINGTSVYLAAYFILVVLSILLISVDNKPLVTNLSAVLSCFNNIGPGLEIVGPTGNFSSYSAFSKLVLIFDMLAGRLEIFPILALISRGAWKKA